MGTPNSLLNLCTTKFSSGEVKVIAFPFLPNLPVLPALCKYSSTLSGNFNYIFIALYYDIFCCVLAMLIETCSHILCYVLYDMHEVVCSLLRFIHRYWIYKKNKSGVVIVGNNRKMLSKREASINGRTMKKEKKKKSVKEM